MKGERGASLVSILVAMGLLALLGTALAVAVGQDVQVRQMAKSSRSSMEVDQAFRDAFVRAIKGGPAACFNPQTTFANVGIGDFGAMQYTRKVLASENMGLISPLAKRNELTAAKSRCRTPRTGNSRRYFCVQFPYRADAPAGTFLNSKQAFAEVYIDYRNIQTNALVNCADHNTPDGVRTSAAQIIYTLHWKNRGPNGVFWNRDSGFFHVTR